MGRGSVTKGLLISLEGLDGVGKTTQIERLHAWIAKLVPEVLSVREPGGTMLGEALRDLVLHRVEAQSGMAEFLVFAAARAELMQEVVQPALARGAVVFMDRFIDSSVAYQAFGHGLNVDEVMTINGMVTHHRMPDLTVWLRGEPFTDQGALRDRMESRDTSYFRQVDAGYEWLSQQSSNRWLILDSRQNADIIFQAITQRIQHLLPFNEKGD